MNTTSIRPGLVSITFRQKSVQQVIQLCQKNALEGIEWGGDVHVPHGDIPGAKQVQRQCADAGLEIAAYGSYYRVGHSEKETSFESVLETALTLQTPLLRVWAGKQDAEDADYSYVQHVVEESRRIGELASASGIHLAFEFHGKTLNNSAKASCRLLEAVDQPVWRTLWQPLVSETLPPVESLTRILPRLANLHVYHWENFRHRFALAAGAVDWQKYFHAAADGVPRWALLEFVRDDAAISLAEDAAVLRRLLGS